MSSKTKIVVLKARELIYTGIFILLGILLILLLIFMFVPSHKSKKTKETSGYTQDQTGPSGTYTKNPRTPGRDQRCGSFNRKTGKSIHKRLVCRTDTDGHRLCYRSDPHV